MSQIFHTENTNQAAALVSLGAIPIDAKKVIFENKTMVKFLFCEEHKQWSFTEICEAWDNKDLDSVDTEQIIDQLMAEKARKRFGLLLMKYVIHSIKWTFFNRTKLGDMINKQVALRMIKKGSTTIFIAENASKETRDKYLSIL